MFDLKSIKAGDVIGDFEIISLLGRGNVAAVFKAKQKSLNRIIALKILFNTLDETDKAFLANFINEISAVSELSCNNLIKAIDAGTHNNLIYFAMEFVDGKTLASYLDAGQIFDIWDILPLMINVASAMSYGFKQSRLTHGDIKPDNMMLTHDGVIKVSDFGLAKTMKSNYFISDELFVSPAYASPESLQGHIIAGNVLPDIYSFGCTLYHLLGGNPPFGNLSTEEVCQKQISEYPSNIGEILPTLPRDMVRLINAMIDKNPLKRPQSWEDVEKSLQNIFKEKGKLSGKVLQTSKTSGIQIRKAKGKTNLEKLLIFVTVLVISTAIGTTIFTWQKTARSYLEFDSIQKKVREKHPPKVMVSVLRQYIKEFDKKADVKAHDLLKNYEQKMAEQIATEKAGKELKK